MVLRPDGFEGILDLILPSGVIETTVDETRAERNIDSSCVSVLNFENCCGVKEKRKKKK